MYDDAGPSADETVIEVTRQRRKPFLGGYRCLKTGGEFHHASTQADISPAVSSRTSAKDMITRGCQKVTVCEKVIQTGTEAGVQVDRGADEFIRDHLEHPLKTSKVPDKILWGDSQRYTTADEYDMVKECKAIIIQRNVRRWLTLRRALRAKKCWSQVHRSSRSSESLASFHASSDSSAEPDIEFVVGAENKEDKGVDNEAYRRMLEELENRHREETAVDFFEDDFAKRQRKAGEVAGKALELIKNATDKRLQKMDQEQALIVQLIAKAGEPKSWTLSGRKTTLVETPSTERAKHFADAYRDLVDSQLDELPRGRLELLAKIVDTLTELPMKPSIRELYKLILREADMITMDVAAANLIGLRRRISRGFLQIVRSPDINPEIARFEKLLPCSLILERPRTTVQVKTEQCRSCQRHLPSDKFAVTKARSVAKCKRCQKLDQKARSVRDMSVFKAMMRDIRAVEEDNCNLESPIFHMQVSDIEYIVHNFWDGMSILSGQANVGNLKLVHWNLEEDWSPWNCALMTSEEAQVHYRLPDKTQVYGPALLEKVKTKQIIARNHFAKLAAREVPFLRVRKMS